jgi:hypothetical protein
MPLGYFWVWHTQPPVLSPQGRPWPCCLPDHFQKIRIAMVCPIFPKNQGKHQQGQRAIQAQYGYQK